MLALLVAVAARGPGTPKDSSVMTAPGRNHVRFADTTEDHGPVLADGGPDRAPTAEADPTPWFANGRKLYPRCSWKHHSKLDALVMTSTYVPSFAKQIFAESKKVHDASRRMTIWKDIKVALDAAEPACAVSDDAAERSSDSGVALTAQGTAWQALVAIQAGACRAKVSELAANLELLARNIATIECEELLSSFDRLGGMLTAAVTLLLEERDSMQQDSFDAAKRELTQHLIKYAAFVDQTNANSGPGPLDRLTAVAQGLVELTVVSGPGETVRATRSARA